ncbi:class I SAM-dependent methyltransferase [Salininema proteolyticum]|uniref:Class I SAM-dependent methyltransferase n=1 Tax=Salininema proteolyticum TaxID=1607685 RepID=A0ABV8TSP2_9ACTN
MSDSQNQSGGQPAPDHYFTASPASEDRERSIRFTLDGKDYELATSSGVFSGSRLDLGTSVLLNKVVPPSEPGVFLDLGCGYGPISTVLAGSGDAEVWAVDVNERALDLTRRNTARCEGAVHVGRPEDVPEDLEFDEIWSNPPIKIGKESLHDLLRTWLPRLKPEGVAWLVVSKHLGGDSLAKWLVEGGWEVDKHASAKGYRVLKVCRYEA